MKHFKLFFALFAMLALNVGNAWGEEVTMTAGTNGSECTVNGINGIKVGTSKTGGDMTITVPAGATSLQLYAAAWKGVTGLSINITPESNVNPTSISLTADDGITSNSPFTLNGNAESFKHEVTLSNITSATTLTLTSSTTKRFVVWGATCTVAEGENPGEGGGEDPTPDDGDDEEGVTYELVTSTSKLEAGAKYIVGNSASTSSIFMSTATNTNNRKVTSAITITDNKVTITEDVLILELGGETGAWTFKTTNYLGTQGFLTSAASGNNNHCKVVATAENCSYFTIAFSDQEATITSTGRNERNILRYNSTNDGLFACYSSGGQSPVYLYKLTISSGGDEGGSEETAASLTANPTSLDFGNVTQNNEVEAKTFTISGSDFTTGELTITAPSGYTVNPTTVPVNGTLEETTITVTPNNTSTVGTFNGNVTISGANLKSSVNVALSMTVEKAPATPTENVYVKVTSTEGITDGEYLIVYEDAASETPAPVAFDGSLATLDTAKNTVAVGISNSTIAGNTDIDAALFTIDVTAGTLKSASGKYIGVSSNSNGLKTEDVAKDFKNAFSVDDNGNAVIAADFEGSTMSLRYNNVAGDNNLRFRYYKNAGQQPIALYKKASKHTVTIADCTNGSVNASVANGAQVLSGTTVTLENTPATGYKLAVYDVYKTGEESTKVTVTDGKFIMPEFDVTISATFELAKTLTGIEITTPATQTTFWKGETFNHEGLKVTAHFDGADDEDVTDKVTVTGSTATSGAAVEVTVSFTEGSTTKTITYTINVKAIPNTQETAYTVADAFDIIDKLGDTDKMYITGFVSQADLEQSSIEQYKNADYWISADGTTKGQQLEAFRGKYLDNTDFTSVNQIMVGDEVIIYGKLTKYGSTYEFAAGNYLVSLKRDKQQPGLAYAETEHTANVGEDFAEPALTNPNNLTVTYSSSNTTLATVNATTGDVTILAAGKVTITASTTGNASYSAGSASYNITITDPALAIATLPFEFNGGLNDIVSTAGITQEGLGSDYTSDNAQNSKLKFDNTGDWLVIHFDTKPDKLMYNIKNNSCSGGEFSVQESTDGETYSTICTYQNEFESAPNALHTLQATSRYVKFIYTEKDKGNVGLGNIQITKLDTRQEAGLAWDPETVTLTVGEEFTAPTFSNPNSLTVSFESSNEDVATVSAEGVIALVDDAVGTATITATFADGHADYKPATATCTITVNEYIETIDGEWQLVTDASKLQIGMEIIIASVADADGTIKTMGAQNNNNRGEVSSTVSGDMLNPAEGTKVITLEDCQLYEGLFALKTEDGYLYAASSSSNHLRSQGGINDNACWTITVTEGVASVVATNSSNHNVMRYNETSDLFSCYDENNNQKDIAIYAKVPDCTREIPVGYYGTVCLPSNIIKVLGATLYEVAGKEDNGRVVFDEVLDPEAGMPYIFLSHNAEVLFYCGTETATEAGKHNSLQGTFNQIDPAVDNILVGNYMVVNNVIKKCGINCGLQANRAYFTTELESLITAPQPMPGRRRVTMGVTGENGTTDLDNITTTDTPVKVIENGQLIIIRDGVKYNVQGVRL